MSDEVARHAAPRRVRVLDVILANQIAAGEVVERPASVLKELMENALDAGASRIDVQAERGGASRIRVRDNGCGLQREDLCLALARHATSKIATLQELEALASMGFRGEALPSIASVSRLRLDSKAADSDSGWCVRAEGGEPEGPTPSAQPVGTSVEVRDLFFNTPARRRFLRSERTEARHLEQVFRRIALARMDVAMSLEHNGRSVLRLPRALDERGWRARLARVLGSPFVTDAVPVSHEAGGLRLRGWLGGPALARERPDMQHLYVNDRAVSDAMVRHAVRLAYAERLAAGAHPAWVLFLQMDPRQVDVNVHPSKQQVRFHETRMVHDFLRQAVVRALGDDVPTAPRPPDGLPERGHLWEEGARNPESFAHAPPAPRPPAGLREPGPLREEGARNPATSAHAPVQRPGPVGEPGYHALALLSPDLLLCRRGEQLVLARGGDLLRHAAQAELGSIANGAAPTARPLLLPERFETDSATSEAVQAGLAPLHALGVRLRQDRPGSWTLLELPACLAHAPAAAVCSALARPPADPDRAEAWVTVLSASAAAGTLRDTAHGVALLELLRNRIPDPGQRPWRELEVAQLEALLSGNPDP